MIVIIVPVKLMWTEEFFKICANTLPLNNEGIENVEIILIIEPVKLMWHVG